MADKYRVDISISLQQADYHGGRLEIRESLDLPAANFFEMAAILGRFHELAESLKKEDG